MIKGSKSKHELETKPESRKESFEEPSTFLVVNFPSKNETQPEIKCPLVLKA
ncbi:hypothetical protein HanPSC8_Chr03g0087601 [Helianthus annuus]|nr:hypothetical protein HanPSC8_Chr03g0087601 [Helianthus annuus]